MRMMEEGYRDSEKRRRSPESDGKGEKRGRSRSPPPSLQEGVKDVCVCVRLNFVEEKGVVVVKWLRLKIPGIFLESFGIDSPPMSSSVPSSSASSPLTGKEDNKVEESQGPRDEDVDEHEDDDEHETPHSGSDTSSTIYDPLSGHLRNWKETICWLDPTNGPFHFTPLVDSPYCYTSLARCAALGSVIYALGGDYHHIDSPLEHLCDTSGHSLTHPGQPLPRRQFTGSHIIGGHTTTTIPRPTSSPSSNDHDDICHRFHFCDFSKQHPKWEVSPHPLITPRFYPKLLSLDGRIYAFGGNHPSDELSPFAEVYDPYLGYWEPLPNPPFGRLSDYELFVFPLPNSSCILVLGAYSRIRYVFDTWTWMWSPCDGCLRLDARLQGQFKRGSSPVIVDDTIYWIHRSGPLCAYKLGIGQAKGKFYEGFITGFEDLDIDRHLKEIFDYPLALLPISKHLLGLFWCSSAPLAFGYYWGSCLHFSLLHVSLLKELELEPETDSEAEAEAEAEMMESYDHMTDCQEPSLTASVVASLTFPFPMDSVNIIDAYLIDDDEESGKLLSSCTSYATLVAEVN